MDIETIWLYTGFVFLTSLLWVISAVLFYAGVEVVRKALFKIKSYRLMHRYVMEHKEEFLEWVFKNGYLKVPDGSER